MSNAKGTYLQEGSRDWYKEPRGYRDVWRCRRGKHQRITVGVDMGTVVCRCSCGGIEFDHDGYWVEANQVSRRRA